MVIARYEDEGGGTFEEENDTSSSFEEEVDLDNSEDWYKPLEEKEPVDNTPTTPYNQTEEDWLKGSAGDEVYNQEGLLKDQEQELENIEDQIDELDPSLIEKIVTGTATVLSGGIINPTVVEAAKKLLSNTPVSDAEKEMIKSTLKFEAEKKKEKIKQTEARISELNGRIKDSTTTVDKNIKEGKERFISEKGREPNADETITIVNQAIDKADPVIQNRVASEELIKSYNPNANMGQFGYVNPQMMGADGNPAIEAGLEQLRQMEAKRAEAQSIRDNTLGQMDSWTKLNADNRDAWAKYYNPTDYQATASTSQGVTVVPASQVSGQYQADLGTLKDTKTDVTLNNADAWQKYFKGVDGYKASTSEAAKTFIAPTASLTGRYQADASLMRDFDPTIATSEERARAVRAGQMMEDRATGKAPSVAELSYEQNLNKLMQSQQASSASQRGSSNPLAMRSVAQQASQLGQQAVMDTAIAKAKEQQEAEASMASQANQVMIADQQKFAQQKQMELESMTNTLQAELQNAKSVLERDMFNIDAQNKVNQLQAQLDSNLLQFNAQQKNVVELQNVQNKMQMTQYAGSQEQQKMLSDLQAQTTSRANELQKNIQYTQGLLQNAQTEFAKDQFNADARNKVAQLQAQLDSQNNQLNAELQTRTSLANAQANLNSSTWAGQMAQGALGQQLQQERADTLAKYGISRDTLGSELDILNNLSSTQIGLGSAQKGWNYQQQQIDAQNEANDNAWYGGLINTGANVLSTGLKILGEKK